MSSIERAAMNSNKFINIYDDLRDKIIREQYPSDQYLPSEHELSHQYVASRETVRKALTLLQNNGFIQKVRGKGSKVIFNKAIHFEVSDLVSFKEQNAKLEKTYDTEVASLEVKAVKDYPQVQKALGMSDLDKVVRIVRTRSIDGIVNIVDIDFFNPQLVPGLTEEIAEDSVYHYIEGALGLEISHSTKTITFDKISEESMELFQSLEPPYAANVTSTVFLKDARPFQYNVSQHRPTSFKFVNFSRRLK